MKIKILATKWPYLIYAVLRFSMLSENDRKNCPVLFLKFTGLIFLEILLDSFFYKE